MRVAVLGSGAWGTALALELNEAGQKVTVWGHDPIRVREINQTRSNARYLPKITLPESIEFTSDFQKAVDSTEFVVMATPSKALRETAKRLNQDADKVKADLFANLVPGVILQHSGVFATIRAQEAGCAFMKSG